VLVAAAICPHPPAIVPELAAGAAGELQDLRDACESALDELRATAPDLLLVVGGDTRTRTYAEGTRSTLMPYGEPVPVTLGQTVTASPGPSEPTQQPDPTGLPLSLAIGAWLLERSGWTGPVRGLGVAEDEPPQTCLDLGAGLAAEADRVGLLVMGDGSARRTPASPGYRDERAQAFDTDAARAFETGDVAALAALDVELAHELMVAGRAPWQVLAGAWSDDVPDPQLLFADAPYGVFYLVAVWTHHG